MSDYPWNKKSNTFTWLSSLYNPFKWKILNALENHCNIWSKNWVKYVVSNLLVEPLFKQILQRLLSPLINCIIESNKNYKYFELHRCWHNFKDKLNPACSCNTEALCAALTNHEVSIKSATCYLYMVKSNHFMGCCKIY